MVGMLRSELEVGEDVTGWLKKESEVAERNENEETKVMGEKAKTRDVRTRMM